MTEHNRGKLKPHPKHQTHLEYYRERNISPVRYTVDGHGERMESLLRQLRVLPEYFRGKEVLEVAAGSGQTAEYILSLGPDWLEVIEPNPAAIEQIEKIGLVRPRGGVKQIKLEDYSGADNGDITFDVVICQNWLGSSAHERSLVRKLASFVAPGGVLLMTVMSPTGLMPNALRRQLAERLLVEGADYDEQVATLARAFAPHLSTMPDMTRSHEDWVRDNMLNPAWQGIGLTLPMLVQDIGEEFDILGTSPDFIEDWRWFKSLRADRRGYNAHALAEIERKDRWFLDYRIYCERDVSVAVKALREAYQMLERKYFTVEDVASMLEFNQLFGRETVHVSLTRRSA